MRATFNGRTARLTLALVVTGLEMSWAAGRGLAPAADTERLFADFGRYEIILERKPFGEEIVPPPAPPPPLPLDSFVNTLKLTAVVREEDGTFKVGLVNTKSNRGFWIGIGDAVDGVEVVDADYDGERARLRRGGEDYWVSMKGGTVGVERVTADTVAAGRGPEFRTGPSQAEQSLEAQRTSYLERRRLREELRRRREEELRRARETRDALLQQLATNRVVAEEETARQVEEALKRVREYQMELIRKGLKPLPIPLTTEMDDQLVKEGVLPPVEADEPQQ